MFGVIKLSSIMKAYIISTDRKVTPFNKVVSKIYSPFINFGNLLKEELALSGLSVRNINSINEIKTDEPSIITPDYVFVTSNLIKKFVFLCKNSPDKVQRLCVVKSKLTDFYTTLMDYDRIESNGEVRLGFDVFYLPKQFKFGEVDSTNNLLETLRRKALNIKVSQNFGIRIERLPNVNNKPYYEEFPITEDIIAHIKYWFHSLFVNILYLNVYKKRIHCDEYSFGFLYKKKIIGKESGKESIIGSNVWIHPTAIIENSIVADNVKIGAKTIIKDSVIMGDCNIGDRNIISKSLFGESVTSLSNSRFFCSIISPRCTVSNLNFSYSMLGERSFLTTAVIFLYEGVNSTIKIVNNGEVIDTGKYFLGSASGEGAILGTRAIVSPGLEIPSNVVIVLRPEEGVMKIPELSESEYYVWDNATLKRFEEVFQGIDKNNFL